MQDNVIAATSYPIASIDSVRFVREIKRNEEGKLVFTSTGDLNRAQLFGAEVGVVVELLNKEAKMNVLTEQFWEFKAFETTRAIDRTISIVKATTE